MNLHEYIEKIESKKDFLIFLSALRADFTANQGQWENGTLDRYLEAMEAWIADSGQAIDPVSWKAFANALYAAKIYE